MRIEENPCCPPDLVRRASSDMSVKLTDLRTMRVVSTLQSANGRSQVRRPMKSATNEVKC
jgi:hypothetical protein